MTTRSSRWSFLHQLDRRVEGFLAEGVAVATPGQGVGLVEERHAAAGLGHHVLGLDGGLPEVAGTRTYRPEPVVHNGRGPAGWIKPLIRDVWALRQNRTVPDAIYVALARYLAVPAGDPGLTSEPRADRCPGPS